MFFSSRGFQQNTLVKVGGLLNGGGAEDLGRAGPEFLVSRDPRRAKHQYNSVTRTCPFNRVGLFD